NAFDCSGLTSYVYSHAIGKYISRTTYSQVYRGKTVKVSTASLKKGDLLFWGSKSSPYHVGIYVGGGQYVHAATPSQGVRKQYLSSYFWPSTAKRVI
ncbi:NlpC/P60 family protein, partial [Lactobacillus delbrueckii subsp. bulgaricus]